jgi:hypothetical protein
MADERYRRLLDETARMEGTALSAVLGRPRGSIRARRG